jgi:glucan biosynthesis protein C
VFTFSILLITHSFFSKHFHFLKLDVFLFFEYFAYFLSGTFFTPNVFKIEFMKVRKLSFFWILAFAGFLVFQDLEITDPLWAYYHGGRFWLRMNHLLLISGVGWFFIFLFVETFHRFLNQSGNVWSYLIEGALPLYLIHHPISLIIGFYLTRINTNLEYKFMIHIFGVIFFTFLIYDVMIKNSPMMRKLFGVK